MPIYRTELSVSVFMSNCTQNFRKAVRAAIKRAGLSWVGTSLFSGQVTQDAHTTLLEKMDALSKRYEAGRFVFKVKHQDMPQWLTLIDTEIDS